ncbi:MAG TPA: TRAP transporter small permease [Candidatus Marinimicrobia bacterium]|nr:TRAP transporter small permease [Candidatus Neomarinimicrobiota bacterium]HRS51297.1 TRAP transporter small permease [Candidatus Neomarinimicrobiota bacterium]HRU91465.1 TRAP transporter small permease [Candidatus Neomarinimicrobiota bacterium]
MLNKIRTIIEKFVSALAVALMLFLVGMAFLQVILRNFFAIGLNVIDELMRNGVLWIAFCGAALTTLRSKHISIDILPRILKGRARRILNWILNLTAAAICFCLSWYAWQFVRLEISMQSMIAGVIPAWIIEIILPVGFFLLALTFPLRLIDESQTPEN